MSKKMYIVHPDDEDVPGGVFGSRHDAEDYAAGLCCSYWIEEVVW